MSYPVTSFGYSLSQNCWDTSVSPCPLNVSVQDLVTVMLPSVTDLKVPLLCIIKLHTQVVSDYCCAKNEVVSRVLAPARSR